MSCWTPQFSVHRLTTFTAGMAARHPSSYVGRVGVSPGPGPPILPDEHGAEELLLAVLRVQRHLLLGQLLPQGVRGKDGRELSDLEGLNSVGEGGGEGALVGVFQLLPSITTFHFNVADLDVSGGRFLQTW